MAPSVLTAGIKAGKLLQGHFNPNQFNYLEVSPHPLRRNAGLTIALQATVSCHGRDKPVLLVGRDSMNRAVAGDVVVVELLPESEWKGAADDVIDPDGQYTLSVHHRDADCCARSCRQE